MPLTIKSSLIKFALTGAIGLTSTFGLNPQAKATSVADCIQGSDISTSAEALEFGKVFSEDVGGEIPGSSYFMGKLFLGLFRK